MYHAERSSHRAPGTGPELRQDQRPGGRPGVRRLQGCLDARNGSRGRFSPLWAILGAGVGCRRPAKLALTEVRWRASHAVASGGSLGAGKPFAGGRHELASVPSRPSSVMP